MLAVPNLDKKMRMEVDTSDYTIGGFYLWNIKIGCEDQWHSSQNLSMRQKEIMRFMTKRC